MSTDSLIPAIQAGAIIAKVTIWPWVVESRYREAPGADVCRRIRIVYATMDAAPSPQDYVPAGAEEFGGVCFVASRFDDMQLGSRQSHKPHYAAMLMARRARAFGKEVDALTPWTDYDPVLIDESVQRWARGGA